MLSFRLAEPSFRIGHAALSWADVAGKAGGGMMGSLGQLARSAQTHARTHAHTHTRSLVRQGRCSCTATRPDLCKCWSGAGVRVVRVPRTGTASDGAGAL